jgi:hypothetical protein
MIPFDLLIIIYDDIWAYSEFLVWGLLKNGKLQILLIYTLKGILIILLIKIFRL